LPLTMSPKTKLLYLRYAMIFAFCSLFDTGALANGFFDTAN
jgi:hypothetical protein